MPNGTACAAGASRASRCLKRGGWQWQHTQMTDPARVARLWLALAVATLWMISVGSDLELGTVSDAADLPEMPALAGGWRSHAGPAHAAVSPGLAVAAGAGHPWAARAAAPAAGARTVARRPGPASVAAAASQTLILCLYVKTYPKRVGVVGAAAPRLFVLRVTHLFRREAGQWKLIHRHADPLAAKTPPEAILRG